MHCHHKISDEKCYYHSIFLEGIDGKNSNFVYSLVSLVYVLTVLPLHVDEVVHPKLGAAGWRYSRKSKKLSMNVRDEQEQK